MHVKVGARIAESITEVESRPDKPPNDGRCLWEELPPELQSIIYRLAYVEDRMFTVMVKAIWDIDEKCRRIIERKAFKARQFPESTVVRFMVTRKWYADASATFLRSTHFFIDGVHALRCFTQQARGCLPQPWSHHLRILSVVLDRNHACSIRALPWHCTSLRKLLVIIKPGFFDLEDTSKVVWEDVWTADDFMSLLGLAELMNLRGLNAVTVVADYLDNTRSRTAMEIATCQANVAIYARLLEHSALRERSAQPDITREADRRPLDVASLYQPTSKSDVLPKQHAQPEVSCTPGKPSMESDALHALPTAPNAIPRRTQEIQDNTRLQDSDIPSDELGFSLLLMKRGSDLFHWVQDTKRRLGDL